MSQREASGTALDVLALRREFPILWGLVHGRPLVYLDNAASCQKPQAVIDAERNVYEACYANVHRGVHTLSMQATEAFEAVRARVRAFVNAREVREIVFTKGTTEAINLVAQTFGRKNVGPDDEVLITHLEHHSNIVPWQMLCEEKGARLRVAPIDDRGEVDMDAFERLLGPRTKVAAISHVSNALGTINDVQHMTAMAHRVGAAVLVDGAQAVPHAAIDVQDIDCDFYAFSAHKAYGPSGVGVLYGKAGRLEAMPPWQGGGDMILSVSFEKTTWNAIPYKFEAGTPNIAGVVALGAAIDWMATVGMDRIARHEQDLLAHGTELLQGIPGVRIVGTAAHKAAVLSFVVDGVHPHDIGTVLDFEGIAIRTGHHCAQPVMERYSVPATARASMACYNTKAELDALAAGVRKVQEMFR